MSNTDTTAERAAVGQLIGAFKRYAAGHLAAALAENDKYVEVTMNRIYETFIKHDVKLTWEQIRFLDDTPRYTFDEARDEENEGEEEVARACERMQELGMPVPEYLMR